MSSITNQHQDFINEVETSLEAIRECTAWSNDSLKELFGRSKKDIGVLKRIEKAIGQFQNEEVSFDSLLQVAQEALGDLEFLKDSLQEKQDNTPENLEGSSAYENREECIDALENSVYDLEVALKPFEKTDSQKGVNVQVNPFVKQAQDKIAKLSKDWDIGFLTEEEFNQEKAKVEAWLKGELDKGA